MQEVREGVRRVPQGISVSKGGVSKGLLSHLGQSERGRQQQNMSQWRVSGSLLGARGFSVKPKLTHREHRERTKKHVDSRVREIRMQRRGQEATVTRTQQKLGLMNVVTYVHTCQTWTPINFAVAHYAYVAHGIESAQIWCVPPPAGPQSAELHILHPRSVQLVESAFTCYTLGLRSCACRPCWEKCL